MHRRTALGGIASVLSGTAGYALLTGTSEAATVDVGGYTIESVEATVSAAGAITVQTATP